MAARMRVDLKKIAFRYFTNMEDLIKEPGKEHENCRLGKGRSYYKSFLVIVNEVGYTLAKAQ